MTLSEKQCYFSRMISLLILWGSSHPGWALRYREIGRTPEQQALYIEEGVSWTMDSKHLEYLAADVYLDIDGVWQDTLEPYRPLGDFWCLLDPANVWGGDWAEHVDAFHFEYAG